MRVGMTTITNANKEEITFLVFIHLLNLNGQVLITKENVDRLELTTLTKGLYFVQVLNKVNGKVETKKLMVD